MESTTDEFADLLEVASERGVSMDRVPHVTRVRDNWAYGHLSSVQWRRGDAEVVLIHGGSQNARTWDSVALLWERVVLAPDMPGHGGSSWRPDHDYRPAPNAKAIAQVLAARASGAAGVVGMSLGGVTALRLAVSRPSLVRRLVLVDIAPGDYTVFASTAATYIDGEATYASIDEMIEVARLHQPLRTESSIIRGIRNNAVRRPDGLWEWKYDRNRSSVLQSDFTDQWSDVVKLTIPVLIVRGELSRIVKDSDVEHFCDLHTDSKVVTIPKAGHVVQSDQPELLVAALEEFLFS